MFTLDDPDQVLQVVEKPLRDLYEALDAGVSFADTVMAGQRPDPHMWAHAVRYHACTVLLEQAPIGYTLGRKLRNSGIELRQGPILMRVLKSRDGGPPHPGVSSARRGFYRQQFPLLPMVWEGINVEKGANLIIDWTVGVQQKVLLALSKPTGVWNFLGQPKLEWRRPVAFDGHDELHFEVFEDQDIDISPVYEDVEDDAEIGGPEGAA
jgi:hypothetical protein